MSVDASTQQIEEVITEALISFGAERESITPQASFKDLDIDSLDLAELSQIIEEKFGVELTSSDVSKVKTVGDAVHLVAERS